MQNPGQTVLGQYRNSPIINQIIGNLNGNIDPAANIAAFQANVWNIATATGQGLDVLGRVVGVGRIVAIPGYGTYSLSDGAYQTLIYAKALANIANGSLPSLNAVLMTLFPGAGDCYVISGSGMAMTVHLGFTPTQVQLAILKGVFPIPVGVIVTWPGASGLTLALAIGSGVTQSGAYSSFAFPTQIASPSGGSGSYSDAWSITASSGGTWTLSAASGGSTVLSVTGVANGVTATATLQCVTSDTVAGGTVTQTASYSLHNTTVAGSFTLTLGPGINRTSGGDPFTFAPNSAHVSGAIAPLTYLWSETDDGAGVWSISGGNTATAVLSVIPSSAYTQATLSVTVTDATGASVTSSATYSYQTRDNPGAQQ